MELFEQIKEEMKKVYLAESKPIAVAFSGGKDSSLLLTLLWEMLLELPAELRTKVIHVLNSDTLVEAPVMSEYVDRTLIKIERKASLQNLPIKVVRVSPKMKDRFFYRVLGRGNLIATPKTKHRGCTHWLKITPMQETLKELIASAPVQLGGDKTVLTLFMGVRVEESARRAASISAFQLSQESLFARHSDFEEIMCFHPIKFVDSDSLWFYLLDKGTLPYGVSVDELAVQYGEGIMECSIKTSSNQGQSCGGSGGRLGCWTCGMTSGQDPMLLRYIEEFHNYKGLLDWKNVMLAMRNDIRYREVFPRQDYNRFFKKSPSLEQIDLFNTDESTKAANRFDTYQRALYEEYAPGGMAFHGRRILLEYLLFIQERDGHALVSEEEIEAILRAWEDTEGISISRSEILPKEFHYDGQLAYLPNKTVNKKETKTKNQVFYVTIELNKEETELYRFLKERQKANQTSLFFFPDCVEFKDRKLVWNKVTFVLCSEGIDNQSTANEHVYKWLGWEFGKFTKETKAAAINYLILSALSEGFSEIKNRIKTVEPYNPLPVTYTEDGQQAFAI